MDIEKWLKGLGLPQYAEIFAAEGIDLSVVGSLSDTPPSNFSPMNGGGAYPHRNGRGPPDNRSPCEVGTAITAERYLANAKHLRMRQWTERKSKLTGTLKLFIDGFA